MLSNALASGKTAESLVMTPAAKFADQQKVELIANTNVSSIDASTRKLASSAGEFSYDNLVLALGADTIKLPIEGDGAGDVVSVNDLNDYAEFRKLLDGKKEVAVLGAGLIGCEFANDLLKADIHTTVFDLADRPLARLLPEQASTFMHNKLAEKGVSWKLGRTVSSVVKNGAGYTLTDSTGETTQADLVLSAVGLKPRTELAKHANLDVARGIVVIMEQGLIADTILNSAADTLGGLPEVAFINLMLWIEIGMSFLVPSSSGLAVLSMPILAPLGDFASVSRDLVVTAYQSASGLVNLITPTSAVVIGGLAIGRVSFDRWVVFVWPLLLILVVFISVSISLAAVL